MSAKSFAGQSSGSHRSRAKLSTLKYLTSAFLIHTFSKAMCASDSMEKGERKTGLVDNSIYFSITLCFCNTYSDRKIRKYTKVGGGNVARLENNFDVTDPPCGLSPSLLGSGAGVVVGGLFP